MKKTIYLTALFTLVFALPAFAHCGSCGVGDKAAVEAMVEGEDVPAVTEAKTHDKMHGKMEKMTKDLGLTEEQVKKIEALMAAKAEKKKVISEEWKAGLAEILTPEQLEKHNGKMKEHKEMKGSHKGSMKGSPKGDQ